MAKQIMQRISENDYPSPLCTNYINERIQPPHLFFSLFLPVTAALLPGQASINHIVNVARETSAVNFSVMSTIAALFFFFLPLKHAPASVSVQLCAAARC